VTLVPVRIQCGAAAYWLAMDEADTSLSTARKLIEEVDDSAHEEALLGRLMTDEEAARATVRDEDMGPTSVADWIKDATFPCVIACSEWP
jgi:hypothetical protein